MHLRPFLASALLAAGLAAGPGLRGEEPAPASASGRLGALYEQGRAWLEENFTEEERAQLPAIDQQQFIELFQPIVDGLATGDFEELARLQPHAAHTLAWLRAQPWGGPYADWLEPRLDYFDIAFESAEAIQRQWAAEQQRQREQRPSAGERPPTLRFQIVRDRVLRNAQSRVIWDRKVAQRAAPARGAELASRVKPVFQTEGVPVQLVWLAEVESSFDPEARSPAGARGLFQLMPATAKRFGLSTFPFDERTHPEKSARAAAQYLRLLYRRFNDWPLALAAYNAGEGRISRALKASKVQTFDAIAPTLPAETRLYVPKVMATVAAREKIDPFALPAPTVSAAPPPEPPDDDKDDPS